jgi:hypothetical protein
MTPLHRPAVTRRLQVLVGDTYPVEDWQCIDVGAIEIDPHVVVIRVEIVVVVQYL